MTGDSRALAELLEESQDLQADALRPTVTNKDSVTHTLTATGGRFNTGDISGGQTKTFTPRMKVGTYHYICNIHQYMTGTIVVR